jgi:oxygen-independent coproporphyrinogen III oxidase
LIMRLQLATTTSEKPSQTAAAGPQANARAALPDQLPSVDVPGLYVHVPFCFHKCHYCDFYSITRQSPERMERFADLILREADGWLDARRGPTVRPRTIFFGGGTPSLLPLEQMRRLLQGLKSRFDFSQLDEWTVECNPATVSEPYSAMLRDEGVNRLSFGAQSFDRNELKILEREHDPADVGRSIEIARSVGFRRLNVDLIYAVPGQSIESWSRSLEQAIELDTEHLSCYALTYEPNTPMAVKKRLGTIRAVEDDTELDMLHYTRARLWDAGYHAYEVSNYARRSPGCISGASTANPGTLSGAECRHNLLYWNGGSYIGLGPSAASHVEGFRWKNRPHLGEWELAVAEGGIPTTDVEQLGPRQRAGELAMLQLRLETGVRFDDFLGKTGFDARELYRDPLARLSTLQLIAVDASGFRLTERGLDVADAVAAEFLE